MNYGDHNLIEITQQTKLRVERVETNVSIVTSVSSRTCFNMGDSEEAVVLVCTNLV